jgi:hypothetical protein
MAKTPLDNPFTAIAAEICGYTERLKAGLCPTCGKKPGKMRDEISRREFAITGMCQPCQDKTFGEGEI